MNTPFRRKLLAASLVAAGAGTGIALPAMAQNTGTQVLALEEIVVTARRRDESLQDVPVTVNAVTSEDINDLNIRKFEDLQGVVAGLTLQEDTIAPNASVRGVRFDTFASGNNATVEFYVNDAPTTSLEAIQALFDVGQIEVLRGPQGTLRGRASPSGSITVTTQKPILDEFGGYVDLTATDIDGRNARAALNVPLVDNMLAVRVAGFWEENNGNDVENVYTGDNSEYEGSGYRFSVAFEPTDTLAINAMYQKIEPERKIYFPVESASIANPTLPASNPFIKDSDRLSVQDTPEFAEQEQETLSLQVAWDIGDHQLNYVYSDREVTIDRLTPFEVDATNAVDASSPATAWQNQFQTLNTVQESDSHELRLQSLEPLFDRVDYVVGALFAENNPNSNLTNPTLLALFVPTGMQPPAPAYVPLPPNFGPAYSVALTPINSQNWTDEKSYFGNLTFHLTDNTELSAGLRRIEYEFDQELIVSGSKLIGPGNVFGPIGDDGHREWEETIYSFSLKHSFSDDLMAYFSYGTSWRPGLTAVGDFSVLRSDLQESFTTLPPEESDSYEVGIKSTWMDGRLRLNANVFHQEFDNYPYRSGGSGVYYISYAAQRDNQGNVIGLAPSVAEQNFVAAVPVEVNGVEIEAFYQATDNWQVGGLFSYAKGEIDNGFVPCNDFLPNDGVPDSGGVPSLGDIAAATGGLFTGDNLTGCNVNYRANNAPLWTTTLTSEYNFTLGNMDAYIRGLWTFYGTSKNDPSNPIDDVDAYNTLNLYFGVRDPGGAWEAMLYGKNVADSEEYTRRDPNPGSISFTGVDVSSQQSVDALGGNVVSDYRFIGLTAPREIGVNFRYNF